LVRFWRSVGRSTKLAGIFAYGALELIVRHPATRRERAQWLHQFAARAVAAMGVTIRLDGHFPGRGALISNHMGYLDIMTYAALHEVVFVSKIEMQKVPLLGWMTTMSGTVYVERGRGGSATEARSGIQATADANIPIVFFPEGTTSDGSSVMKFHSGVLAQVLDAGEPVTAAFIRYRLTENNGPNITVSNDVCFWGDEVQLFPHIFRLLALRGIEVSVQIAEAPIAFSEAAGNRKVAALEAHAAVMEVGGLTQAETVPR
jgi:1-acyl-sn-glycerol-3-phosphate acyltransferase